MGFTVTYHRRKADLVAELTRSEEGFAILAHSLRGNHLWKLVRLIRQGKRITFIALDSLGSHRGEWGYKDLSEFMGPCESDCPLRFLKEADPLDPADPDHTYAIRSASGSGTGMKTSALKNPDMPLSCSHWDRDASSRFSSKTMSS